jgi:energy-coupling factor transport system ATP-binding protein
MSDYIVSVKGAVYKYEGAEDDAVAGVSLDIRRGEFLAVLGRNGSGKSTLAKMLNALIVPSEGTVLVDGISPDSEDKCYEIRTRCGMVFQNPDNQIVSTIVEEDCAFGLENLGVPSPEIRRRVDEALSTVGMSDFALSAPHMLSGGQKQRVAIAGVVAMRPKIIVFDESTAMLDPVGRRDIFALARKLNREENITIVWITHFMDEAAKADRVAVMDKGKLVMEGEPQSVFAREEEIRALGLDVPEMARLAGILRKAGLDVADGIMSVTEMEVELCRSR